MTQRLLTPYQSQYYAWLLTRRAASNAVESLASTLVDSQVDLNPLPGRGRTVWRKLILIGHCLIARMPRDCLACVGG